MKGKKSKKSKKSKKTKKHKVSLKKGRRLSATPSTTPAAETPVKTARLIFNEELQHFYDDISIIHPTTKTHIYHIAKPPVDVDKLRKFFNKGDGIDPSSYEPTNFGMNSDKFYKALFKHRDADVAEPNLLYFLTDFTEEKKNLIAKKLEKEHKMGSGQVF